MMRPTGYRGASPKAAPKAAPGGNSTPRRSLSPQSPADAAERPASAYPNRRPLVPPARDFPPMAGLTRMPLEDLSIGVAIGKGRFKQVHRGTLKGRALGENVEDKDIVVLRYAKGKAECKTELQVLSRLTQLPGSSDHVPIVWGVCDQGRDLIVVQERALGGSLKGAVLGTEEEPSTFTPAHGLRVAAQIARAMACLETARVVHADLSCRNVLICCIEQDARKVQAKVTDIGLSIILKEGAKFEIRKQPQATRWCSPETVLSSRLSHQSDAWSLGTLFWELFSGCRTPWVQFDKRTEVAAKLKSFAEVPHEASAEISQNFPQQDAYPPAAHRVILSCLQVHEEERLGFVKIAEAFDQIIADQARPRAGSTNSAAGRANVEMLSQTNVSTQSQEGPATPSTSATPPAPLQLLKPDGSRNQVYEDKLTALLELQEARLTRLEALARTERWEQVERLERRERLSTKNGPVRDTVIPLAVSGVPSTHSLPTKPAAGLSGAWTLQTFVGTNLLRKQEFYERSDAWAAFVEAADQAQPCLLRDPHGGERASSSWIAVEQARAQAELHLKTGQLKLGTAPAATPTVISAVSTPHQTTPYATPPAPYANRPAVNLTTSKTLPLLQGPTLPYGTAYGMMIPGIMSS
eukprot:TRINITY_DN98243_c0_g1_i1.p1 TRINITY_DN98243_c0_g1~~TRINITY_DN98243_c0_g1_i1.p1  ORF type:complete len:637 (+),score=120.08 TRINITY_DN98243_c0_g1_i1:75-1985(+)